ncbi:Protein of unknown function [Leuconostoc citreum]|nr:Protein of unknown function [Leuconostoc citreum LBAE C10]CCF26346.1 Protein of unknown function [Leuconostoc citreum LBAE C11]CCF28507.1 Protein of unknown function [Leuconostoc citreum LBAE E16]CDX64948.1 Protein of unknown function [Leuconostoc citreum]CDX66718.1 Putative uncharacterized protein [Leuconostoc citreum]
MVNMFSLYMYNNHYDKQRSFR